MDGEGKGCMGRWLEGQREGLMGRRMEGWGGWMSHGWISGGKGRQAGRMQG